MVTGLWMAFLLSLACASAIAWLAALMHERGLRPVRELAAFLKRHSVPGRVILSAFFIGMCVYGSTKSGNGGGGDDGGAKQGGVRSGDGARLVDVKSRGGCSGDGAPAVAGGTAATDSRDGGGAVATGRFAEAARTLTAEDFGRGFVLTGIGTGETFCFDAHADADVCGDWRAFGAAEDWIYLAFTNWALRIGEASASRLRVHSCGWAEALPDCGAATGAMDRAPPAFMPFRASLGIVPEANWPMLGDGEQGTGSYQLPTTNYQLKSLFWHLVTPSNTLQLTWRNVLLDRSTSAPVNVQMEMWPSGRFAYRYGLSRLGVGEATNILVGASLGTIDWTTNALPTNVTSLAFHPLSPEDAADPDRDGDGLSLLDELFAFGTDPDLWDTDHDGLSDGEEVALGTDPLRRDTDGDGLVDGSDPDPLVPTPMDDLDGDGIPDAYEDFWFGGTNAFDTAAERDGTGFTLAGKMLCGLNPTNAAPPAAVAAAGSLVSWRLFGGFAADWPAGMTNLVWERTFAVGLSNPWQGLFVSASPAGAAGWMLEGSVLEWETDAGDSGSAAASPFGDSLRIPLSTNAFPHSVTLRVRATAPTACSPSPLHLIAYAPAVRVEGGDGITGLSGAKFNVFTDGTRSKVRLAVDRTMRPCRAAPSGGELDSGWLADAVESGSGGWMRYAGDANGGEVAVLRPGVCPIPDCPLPMPSAARAPRRRSPGGGGGGIVVLDPSARWECGGHGCAPMLMYSWQEDRYSAGGYPLDTACLRRSWCTGWSGQWYDGGCALKAVTGVGLDAGCVTSSSDGGTCRVYVDGVEVWSGTAAHSYGDRDCGEGSHGEDILGGGCGGCDDDCADGACDSLEGASLGSLRFRIPLGRPVKGHVAGFAWFSADGPVSVSRSTFRVLGHPDAHVADTASPGARRIACGDRRGRDLRIEDVPNGVRVTVYDAAAQTLEHTWEIANVDGDPSRVRLRKVSRLGNVMSDETYTCSGGSWTRLDGVSGAVTRLVESGGLSAADGGKVSETETVSDAAGNVLSSVTVERSRIGDCDNAVLRETFREESTGAGTRWAMAGWWDDPRHSARHGRLRLMRGNALAWRYSDWDADGRETLRVEQRDGSPVPADFPSVSSNGLCGVSGLSDAFVTVWGYGPHSGDSCHQDDAALPRTETRYVVANGVATAIGRTWTRYTRLTRGGYAAVRKETWRAGSQGDEIGDAANAYSYGIAYADTGDGTPLLMRNAVAESLDEDGILTVNAYSLTNGVLSCATRRYGPYAGGSPSPATAFPTYTVTEADASYGTVLRRTMRLTEGDTVIEDERSVYDSRNRLRSTTYLDGTSLTNAYSCCRLLWRRDREGCKTLRSAQTGTDHLYNAIEDVWLADMSTNGQYRVTQRFYDALGRETNTVVYAGTTPGEAVVATAPPPSRLLSVSSTAYPLGGDGYRVETDGRGVETVTERLHPGDGTVVEAESVRTGGVEVVRTTVRSAFGGGTSVRREWGAVGLGPDGEPSPEPAWADERRFDGYAADGRRVAYVVTESSDCGTVTNSVTTYDWLGRVVERSVPGANGSMIHTTIAYLGSTSRKASETTTGNPIVTCEYDDCGELVSMTQNGAVNRVDTNYETVSGEVWQVRTATRETGSTVHEASSERVQLTGLSDALRSRRVSVRPSGVTRSESSFDPSSGLLTTVTRIDGCTAQTNVTRYGMAISSTSLDGRETYGYDAFGRRISASSHDIDASLPRSRENHRYNAMGDLVETVSDFGADGCAMATAAYDAFGREVSRTDAMGNTVTMGHDALGRTVAIGGDTYPLRYGHDAAGRRTSLATTRDGATWGVTRWAYDAATGLCSSKTYADGSHVAYAYADNGNKTRTTWARGAWKQNAYNARNFVSGTTYSETGTPSVAYAYEDSGKVASATLSDGTAYAYGYDDRLLNTNENVAVGGEAFSVNRTFDGFRRGLETSVTITNVVHAAKVRSYDSENRVCGYALTNAVGRGVSVSLAYDGSYLTNMAYALPGGVLFSARLSREPGRKALVTRRDYAFGGQSAFWDSTEYDLLGRPTNAADSVSLVRAWLYNRRSELAAANIGTNRYGYFYDTIGNRLWSAANSTTNFYTANALNQYTQVGHDAPIAPPPPDGGLGQAALPVTPTYDADGNMTDDGSFLYAYDAENRLASAYPVSPAAGSLAVVNRYDHRHRRVKKTVKRYDGDTWGTAETHAFVWDENNIVLEKVEFANGTTRTFEYFWGADKSGTEQGAGGVGGLLAVSVDGVFYIPCYDHNGNIVLYVSEAGNIAARYTYDPYGNITDMSGALATQFSFGFSTKCHDRETGLVAYQRRFYSPGLGRWLNRDPIEERGGENLYAFCENAPSFNVDYHGFLSIADIKAAVNKIHGLNKRLSDAMSALRECIGMINSWRPGGQKDSMSNDKYRHCVASCEIAKACGDKVSLVLGILKELRDILFGLPQNVAALFGADEMEMNLDSLLNGDAYADSIEDLAADVLGIDLKNSKGGCECACKQYYLP